MTESERPRLVADSLSSQIVPQYNRALRDNFFLLSSMFHDRPNITGVLTGITDDLDDGPPLPQGEIILESTARDPSTQNAWWNSQLEQSRIQSEEQVPRTSRRSSSLADSFREAFMNATPARRSAYTAEPVRNTPLITGRYVLPSDGFWSGSSVIPVAIQKRYPNKQEIIALIEAHVRHAHGDAFAKLEIQQPCADRDVIIWVHTGVARKRYAMPSDLFGKERSEEEILALLVKCGQPLKVSDWQPIHGKIADMLREWHKGCRMEIRQRYNELAYRYCVTDEQGLPIVDYVLPDTMSILNASDMEIKGLLVEQHEAWLHNSRS